MTVYLFDRNKNLTGDIHPDAVITHTQTQVLGGQITATVTAVYDQEIEDAYYFGSQDVDNPNVFWLYRVTAARKKDGQIALTGIYIMFDELQGHVIRDVRPQGVTAHVALDRILQGTGWEAGLNFATGTAGASYYYQTALSAFWDFCKVWSIEFKPRLTWANGVITGRYIDIYDQLSDDYGKWYEYGDQLISIEAEQTSSEIVTALIGMGKGEEVGDGFGRKIRFDDIAWSTANGDPVNKPAGQDYVALPAAVDLYGYREGVVDFPDIEDKGELLTATYQALLTRSRPKVQFAADALETGMVEIGETVTIVRDDIGIRYKTRVFEVERNFLDKQIKKFKFGDRVITSSAERIKGEKVEQAKQEQRLTDRIAAVFAAIAESYWGEDGYNYDLPAGNEYGLPGGLYSFDAPIDQNPSKVIYVGAGKFLIANSKKPDGTWDFRTFGDGDGLGADIVTAYNIQVGAINSDHIDTAGLRADLITLSNERSVEDAMNSNEASIQQVFAEMQIVDGKLSTTVTDLGILADTQLSMLQTQEQWQVVVQAIQQETGSNTVTLGDVLKYMQFDDDFLTIGKTGSSLSIQITNEAVNFLDGGEKVAWISGQQLHIGSAVILKNLTVGNHIIEKYEVSGNSEDITIFRWANG